MHSLKNPLDLHPFRSKAELENEQSLQANYRRLGNPDVVAALRWKPTRNERPSSTSLAAT